MANRLAHHDASSTIDIQHIVYGVFCKLRAYKTHIFCTQECPELDILYNQLCNTLEIPETLPPANGAFFSYEANCLLTQARGRGKMAGHSHLVIEDVLLALLTSYRVRRLFESVKNHDALLNAIKDRLETVSNPRKARMAERPQFCRRNRRRPVGFGY
ncbi:MAG TPA: hypothetical protein VLG69_01935 [Candidatus Andersenbacteria bacterium]|nr:hypothetical protein [Candidatus Andersenbacteria bacterium]